MTEYVNATQAARLIGVNERSVRYWIAKDQIRFTRQKRSGKTEIAIPMAEIERIIAERQERAEMRHVPTPREMLERIEELRAEVEAVRSQEAPDLSVILERFDAIEHRLDALESRQGALPHATAPVRAKSSPNTRTRRTSSSSSDLSESEIEAVIIDALASTGGKNLSARMMYQNRAYLLKANQAEMLEPALIRLVESGKIVRASQSDKGTWFYALPALWASLPENVSEET